MYAAKHPERVRAVVQIGRQERHRHQVFRGTYGSDRGVTRHGLRESHLWTQHSDLGGLQLSLRYPTTDRETVMRAVQLIVVASLLLSGCRIESWEPAGGGSALSVVDGVEIAREPGGIRLTNGTNEPLAYLVWALIAPKTSTR